MRFGNGPLANTPTVVKNLVIINALLLLVKYIGHGQFLGIDLEEQLSLHFIKSPEFKPWQLVTHMFMHADFWHLFMNMLGLFMLGAPLEYRWGSKRFLVFYMICGLGGAALNMAAQGYDYSQLAPYVNGEEMRDVITYGKQAITNLMRGGDGFDNEAMNGMAGLYFGFMRGASGAVFGILVAFGMLYPNVELMIFPLPIPIKAKYFVLLYGAYELYAGYAGFAGLPGGNDGVAHFAHIGGAVAGFITVMIWKRRLPDT